MKEPTDLHASDNRRPDLQIILGLTEALCDVRISNPLCPTHVRAASKKTLAAAAEGERNKTNKYSDTASQHGAKFIPFVMEATGGMADGAVELMKQIVLASRDNNTLWEHEVVSRELRGALAIDVSFYSDVV